MSVFHEPATSHQKPAATDSSGSATADTTSTSVNRSLLNGWFVDAKSNLGILERSGSAEHIGSGSLMVAIRCK